MSTKVIVTNMSVLRSKYGRGVSRITQEIKQLISADKLRGVKTKLLAIDDATAMSKLKAKCVSNADDPKQNKIAIDGVYAAMAPDYLVILGAIDVIPHQDLRNPVFCGDDPDRYAYSDLPYACDAPYSRKIEDFTGPTRVVGRIADITKGTDPGYLVGLIKTATKWKSRPLSDYDNYLGISAYVWQDSTKLSLKNLFGSSSAVHLSPPDGPKWSALQLKARSHFINCHGAMSDPVYYGQKGNYKYPDAHRASWVEGKLSNGTVATAECCYGAELYDPTDSAGQMGICNAYLKSGAYGFFGSSTIAYGPASGNSAADLICQYFLKHVFEGASLGRAVLETRHDFAQSPSELDPVDQKTLAQFSLFGDPSIHPVQLVSPKTAVSHKAVSKITAQNLIPLAGRTDRRRQLAIKGQSIGSMVSVAVKSTKVKPTGSLKRVLNGLAKQAKVSVESGTLLSFQIRGPKGNWYKKAKAAKTIKSNVLHILLKDLSKGGSPVKRIEALIAKEEDGNIVSYQELYSR
ncbi:MAG: hypothetical protein FVQ79_11500 [Planctomycetes bacterium]|nr:hypothetical protein [Planctomycetota bacterium]